MPIELKGDEDYKLISPFVLYDPETGLIKWRERLKPAWFNQRFAGKKATFVDAKGYLAVKTSINGRQVAVRAHRLAYFIFYGDLQNKFIDHINRNRQDNRIQNLRLVSCLENSQNRKANKANKTGAPGLEKRKDKKLWSARRRYNNKTHFLGYFAEKEMAIKALNEFDKKIQQGEIT